MLTEALPLIFGLLLCWQTNKSSSICSLSAAVRLTEFYWVFVLNFIISKIRKKARTNPISLEEISKEVELVREKRYAKANRWNRAQQKVLNIVRHIDRVATHDKYTDFFKNRFVYSGEVYPGVPGKLTPL